MNMYDLLTKEDIAMIVKNDQCAERLEEIKQNLEGNDLRIAESEKSQLKSAIHFLQAMRAKFV